MNRRNGIHKGTDVLAGDPLGKMGVTPAGVVERWVAAGGVVGAHRHTDIQTYGKRCMSTALDKMTPRVPLYDIIIHRPTPPPGTCACGALR